MTLEFENYDQRIAVHRRLLRLHERRDLAAFAKLLLGISDAAGNYSAAEHNLGPKILATNGDRVLERIYDLATRFIGLQAAREVPGLIRAADVRSLLRSARRNPSPPNCGTWRSGGTAIRTA